MVTLLAAVMGGGAAFAQVSESPELATLIKNEGLNNSKIEELSQFITDYLGSRLTASQQKRRAENLVVGKLGELGLSNPRAEFAYDFPRGGWDVVKTYVAMTSPYYCAFTVNPRVWTGSTNGLVKGECIVFDVNSKEDLEKYSSVYPATEDGSVGTKGNVMDAIREKALEADVIFACGPMPMLRAIKAFAQEKQIPAYISLEEHMACGVGACLGCVVKTKEEDHHSHVHNARICTDGPVFEAGEVEI